MSITAIDRQTPQWALYLIWLGAAIFVAMMTGILRPCPPANHSPLLEKNPDPRQASMAELMRVLLLVIGAIGTFSAWVLVQALYALARHPAVDASSKARWSPGDLVTLNLIAPGIGWCVGLLILKYHREFWLVGYSRRRFLSGIFIGTLGILVALPVVLNILEGTLWLYRVYGYEHPQKHDLLIALDDSHSLWVHLGGIVAAVVAAPMFEEMLFRGFLQTATRRLTRSPWVAILIPSLLFASIHDPWTRPPIFIFAVLLGLVYERTHNLWATTFMHAMFNAFAIITSGP